MNKLLSSSSSLRLKETTSRFYHALSSSANTSVLSSNSTKRSLSSQRQVGDHLVDGLLQFTTLHEIQKHGAVQFRDNALFGTHDRKSKFDWMTYAEFDTQVALTRDVLLQHGVKAGSTVGMISNNRWEWAAVASACYSLSAVMVPMYEAQMPSDWTHILNDSGCENLIVANQSIFDRATKVCKAECPALKSILCLDAAAGEPHSFKTALSNAKVDSSTIIAPSPSDLANLIYTSGTTGKPKGVELTHNNQCSNIFGVRKAVGDATEFFSPEDRSLSFLPWAHVYGQTSELFFMMSNGSSSGLCRGVPDILEDLELVKPTLLYSVPTLYKRVYDGVQNSIVEASPIKRTLMNAALSLGAQKAAAEREGKELGFPQSFLHTKLDGLVLSKIRERFGGELRLSFTGGAAMPIDVINFMDNIGIPVYEGYGLTETSPIACISTPENRQIGSVGKAIADVDVFALDPDGKRLPAGVNGEICVSGPNIMKGYHNRQDATDECVTMMDGVRVFHTGDIGKVNEDGFIYITGRLKEAFKLENGKYVQPTPVEEKISLSRFILQTVLYGDNKPYNVSLIVPDYLTVRAHLKIADSVTNAEICLDPKVNALIMSEIALHSKTLKKFEIPQKVHLVAEPYTVENQMMTPKMSIRRAIVMKNYANELAALYA